jgi:hypothetical protein
MTEKQQNPGLLLDAVEAFDREFAPLGLYAAGDYGVPQAAPAPQRRLRVEWERCLQPAVRALGCNPWFGPTFARDRLSIAFQPGSRVRCLTVVRLSKVKVRRYGNSYRVDPHQQFAARWREADLGGTLQRLRGFVEDGESWLLFIGFASGKEPFGRELDELETATSFRSRISPSLRRTWLDPHGRGFHVETAFWRVAADCLPS